MKKRNENLDLLRTAACLAVISLHTFNFSTSLVNSIIYYLSGFAVPVFFMSSGYILANRETISYRHMIKKSANIFLIVVCWNLLLYIGTLAYKLLSGNNAEFDFIALIKMPFRSMLQKGFLGHFWYMGALILVYILVCVLAILKKKIKNKDKLNLCLCIFFIALSVGLQILSYFTGSSIQKNIPQMFRIWNHLMNFMIGGVIAVKLPTVKEKLSVKAHTIIFAVMSIIIPIFQINMNYLIADAHAEYFYDDILTIIWTTSMFSLIMRVNISQKLLNISSSLVKYTMGVYIVHIIILKVIKHFVQLNTFPMCLLAYCTTTAGSFAVVYIIVHIPAVKKLVEI